MNQAKEKTPSVVAPRVPGTITYLPVYRTAPKVTSRFKKWLKSDREERGKTMAQIASSIIFFAIGYYTRFALEAVFHGFK